MAYTAQMGQQVREAIPLDASCTEEEQTIKFYCVFDGWRIVQPTVVSRECKFPKSHAEFKIIVNCFDHKNSWTVYRRFDEFRKLSNAVNFFSEILPRKSGIDGLYGLFPSRTLWTSSDSFFLEERILDLSIYIDFLCKHKSFGWCFALDDFLAEGDYFRKFDEPDWSPVSFAWSIEGRGANGWSPFYFDENGFLVENEIGPEATISGNLPASSSCSSLASKEAVRSVQPFLRLNSSSSNFDPCASHTNKDLACGGCESLKKCTKRRLLTISIQGNSN